MGQYFHKTKKKEKEKRREGEEKRKTFLKDSKIPLNSSEIITKATIIPSALPEPMGAHILLKSTQNYKDEVHLMALIAACENDGISQLSVLNNIKLLFFFFASAYFSECLLICRF